MPPRTSTVLIAAVLAATLAVAACTTGTSTTTTTLTTAAPDSAADITQPSAPSSSTVPVSKATITSIPGDDAATGASVLDPVVVKATNGTLDTVAVTNPEGKEVTGSFSADGTTWTSAEPLGYGRTYTITAAARDTAGLTTSSASSFTTVTPAGVIFPSFEPPPDRGAVGVGQPISVIFDKAPPDRAAAERALTVTTVPAQVGGWYWVDERTMHYRPQVYWQAGTQVTVDAKVYGVNLGGGFYGETDRTLNLTIGPAKVATVDDVTKQLTVTIDGQVARQFPVSMGRDESITVDGKVISFVTPSGIYVAQEKYDVKQMNSGTYGLPTSYDLGYDSAIPLAIRLSNSGIFATPPRGRSPTRVFGTSHTGASTCPPRTPSGSTTPSASATSSKSPAPAPNSPPTTATATGTSNGTSGCRAVP
jgi:hypothetical protein